jgi:hypothetical protein
VHLANVTGLLGPGYLLVVLLILAVSALCYAVLPYRRRRFLLVLLLATIGMLAGEVWAALGFPAINLGDANLVPGIPLAVLLQVFQDRLQPRRVRSAPGPRQ